MTAPPGYWVKKTSFAMPLLPPSVPVDPVLAALIHCVAFLELSEDEAVDPDGAVEAMEHVAAYLTRLPAERVGDLRATLSRLAEHARSTGGAEELVEFLEEFVDNFGLGTSDTDSWV